MDNIEFKDYIFLNNISIICGKRGTGKTQLIMNDIIPLMLEHNSDMDIYVVCDEFLSKYCIPSIDYFRGNLNYNVYNLDQFEHFIEQNQINRSSLIYFDGVYIHNFKNYPAIDEIIKNHSKHDTSIIFEFQLAYKLEYHIDNIICAYVDNQRITNLMELSKTYFTDLNINDLHQLFMNIKRYEFLCKIIPNPSSTDHIIGKYSNVN